MRLSRQAAGLRLASRALLVAAFAWAVYTVWTRSTEVRRPPAGKEHSLRLPPPRIDWGREPFKNWASPEDGIELQYPARYEAVRGLGTFTSRVLREGLTETDVAAFRCAEPRSVIVAAAYRSPRPRTWKEWTALARAGPGPPPDPASDEPSAFAMEFGGSDREYHTVAVTGVPCMAVSARGAVKYPARGNDQMELWRFESRLFARGERAVRVTAGVHEDHYAAALPGLERVLESFRWSPAGD